MVSVRTSILGRPRPSSADRRAGPNHPASTPSTVMSHSSEAKQAIPAKRSVSSECGHPSKSDRTARSRQRPRRKPDPSTVNGTRATVRHPALSDPLSQPARRAPRAPAGRRAAVPSVTPRCPSTATHERPALPRPARVALGLHWPRPNSIRNERRGGLHDLVRGQCTARTCSLPVRPQGPASGSLPGGVGSEQNIDDGGCREASVVLGRAPMTEDPEFHE